MDSDDIKDILHVISYRFDKTLMEPYYMIESRYEPDLTFSMFVCKRMAYGDNIGESVDTTTGIPENKFSIKKHMEVAKNAHSKP